MCICPGSYLNEALNPKRVDNFRGSHLPSGFIITCYCKPSRLFLFGQPSLCRLLVNEREIHQGKNTIDARYRRGMNASFFAIFCLWIFNELTPLVDAIQYKLIFLSRISFSVILIAASIEADHSLFILHSLASLARLNDCSYFLLVSILFHPWHLLVKIFLFYHFINFSLIQFLCILKLSHPAFCTKNFRLPVRHLIKSSLSW